MVLVAGGYEVAEDGVGLEGFGLEFGVELAAEEEGRVGISTSMESGGSDADAFAGEDGLVFAVKLVAVTAAFDDDAVAKMGHPNLVVG